MDVVVPYARGDLLSRAHTSGEVDAVEHTAAGTRLRARVGPDLAADLADVAVGRAAG